MAWSIVPLLARMGFVHVVLLYGTNNVDLAGLTDPVKIHHREIGSRLVLGARIFYALLYVSSFCGRISINTRAASGWLNSPCLSS